MANERENNTNYTIYENGPLGEVQIANEVVAIIAGIAGAVTMALVSVVSNYFVIYPLYFTVWPKEAVLGMYQAIMPSIHGLLQALVVFNMPFTFCKGLICVLITILIYKPLIKIINQ